MSVALVLLMIRSAPARWSKCEWPITIQSHSSTSSAVSPVPGAPGARSMYASRKIVSPAHRSRNVAHPYQSSVATLATYSIAEEDAVALAADAAAEDDLLAAVGAVDDVVAIVLGGEVDRDRAEDADVVD